MHTPSPREGGTSDDRLTLRLLGLASFAAMAALRICDAMLGPLAKAFHVSPGAASWVVAAFALSYGVLQLIYGPLGDVLGKLRVITWASTACTLIALLTPLSTSLDMLVGARMLMGAAAAAIIPLSMAWIGDKVAYERRQETLARLLGAIVLGMMTGQWFGGFASDHFGWQSAFLALALSFLAATVCLHVQLRRTRATAAGGDTRSLRDSLQTTRTLLTLPRVRWVLGVGLIEGALAYGWLPFAPHWLMARFELTLSTAGSIMILYGVGGLLYSHFARHWLTWLGERGLAQVGGSLIALSLLLLAWVPVAGLAMAACGLAGLGFYMLHSTMQTQATQMAPTARATGMTLFVCCLFLGQALGVMLVGAGVDRGWLAPTFSLVALLMLGVGSWIAGGVQARPATA